MTALIETSRLGDILVATFTNPPVNAISHGLRCAMADMLAELSSDDALAGAVIRCAGRTFFSGADIHEFGQPPASPTLQDLAAALLDSSKPVVMAMHGQALGGGLELALTCQGRVCSSTARLGLPEVKLGLLPGAGGTQLLPRLVDSDLAVEMIAMGEPIAAERALKAGLVDRVSEDEALLETAVERARELSRQGWRDLRLAPLPPALAAATARFAERHARRFRGQDAPAAIFAVLSQTVGLPFTEGLKAERAAFERLRDSAQSKALRHVFMAERQTRRLPELDGVTPRPIDCVAVVGAGTMGSGIAAACLLAGLEVILVEQDEAGLAAGSSRVEAVLTGRGQAGTMDRMTATLDWNLLARCDLVIEAAFEDLAVKQAIFARLGGIARPGAVLATNTSYLDVDAIAEASGRPTDVIGLHFFSPAHVMKLLEIIRGRATARDGLATALAFAAALGKVPVVAANAFGFIGNRMLAVRKKAAEELLLQCRSPEPIDRALEAFGFAMGPFKVSDLAGLDLGWSQERTDAAILRDRFCSAGRRGRKTGAGYYDYDEAGKPRPSPYAITIIDQYAAERQIAARDIAEEEIVARLLDPMIDEAKAILAEGVARSEADIDVVWIAGYGWPRWTGGPMYWDRNR